MSMKNIVIRLETQQKLTRISLPGTSGSRDISITDYLPVSLQLRNLRDITLELSTSHNVDDVSSAIVRKSPSLNSVHLRFSAQDNDPFFQISAAPTRWPSSRCFLFSLATKLTILSYDFRNFTALLSMPTLPRLQANLTACDKLQTLTLRCSSGFSSQHTMLAAKKIALLSDRTQSEKLIGDATLSQLTHRGSILNDHTLQYLAVIVKNGASGWNVTGSDIEIIR